MDEKLQYKNKRTHSDEYNNSSESDYKKHHKKHKHKEKKVKKDKKHKKERKHKDSLNTKLSIISPTDYYGKSIEFRTWLLETKNIYIEDLSTEEAKNLFKSQVCFFLNVNKKIISQLI